MTLRGIFTRRVKLSVAFGEIATAERVRRGYRLHGSGWENLTVLVAKSRMRDVEQALRCGGVMIVDEVGARIDASQFEKEADPAFNRNVDDGFPSFWASLLTPNFVLRWRHERSMRQSSDDATRE